MQHSRHPKQRPSPLKIAPFVFHQIQVLGSLVLEQNQRSSFELLWFAFCCWCVFDQAHALCSAEEAGNGPSSCWFDKAWALLAVIFDDEFSYQLDALTRGGLQREQSHLQGHEPQCGLDAEASWEWSLVDVDRQHFRWWSQTCHTFFQPR